MAVYLFTLHAYRSWNADRPEGFVQRGQGIQPTNPALAEAYDEAAGHPPVIFDRPMQRLLIETGRDVCKRREWRLHGASVDATHLHMLVSWQGYRAWSDVRGKIRNIMSLELSKQIGPVGRPWFSREGSRKHVTDRRHFDHLMQTYLPKHCGLQWYEDRGWVEPPEPPPPGGG
jgi:REP element-mobilizing transposase RayT